MIQVSWEQFDGLHQTIELVKDLSLLLVEACGATTLSADSVAAVAIVIYDRLDTKADEIQKMMSRGAARE